MKHFFLLLATFGICVTSLFSGERKYLKLWYQSPAEQWEEALPIGNGRLGAMLWGGVEEELIQLNEETLWSGRPVDNNPNPQAITYLQQVRDALGEQNFGLAQSLCHQMQGYYTESYLPMGDLRIRQDIAGDTYYNYYRELDLENAIAKTSFSVGGVDYEREAFAYSPGQAIVIKYNASVAKSLNVMAELSSQLHFDVETRQNGLLLTGRAPVHVEPSYVNSPEPIVYEKDGHRGMRFGVMLEVDAPHADIEVKDGHLTISNATTIIFKVMAETSFSQFDKDPDTEGKDEIGYLQNDRKSIAGKSYVKLRREHVADYRQYFDRVKFDLSEAKNTEQDFFARLLAYGEGAEDLGLEELYYQYNRYLLISCSRPNGYPANLQGIWNKELRAPWSSNYTININAEMNYWPAEVSNLSEMHLPFIDMVSRFASNGRHTAKNFYGARGWSLSHNSDLWAQTNPVGNKGAGDPTWANWYMGSPWVSQHLMEHYRFTNDKEYLQCVYPLLKSAAEFCLDWLIPDDKGHLITAPSTSPENRYRTAEGKVYGVSCATTMDLSILWDLFCNVIEAAEIVGDDVAFVQEVRTARSKLFPLQIGSKGQLQEWWQDYEEQDPHHRHVSHLYGLFPGRQITPFASPDLAQACKRSLQLRGDNGTGWSLAWKVNLWARLLDGNHAYSLLRNLLKVVTEKGENYDGGGIYPNLFCAHPPFQIDGNFGGLSGMNEMLLQSHDSVITLLPALPEAWHEGSISGLCARGGFVMDMQWSGNRLSKAVVYSRNGSLCRIRTSAPIIIDGRELPTTTETYEDKKWYLSEFKTLKGKKYTISLKSNPE